MIEPIKLYEGTTCCWRKARENARKRVAIGFGFTSDWMKRWREFYEPIAKRFTTNQN